jgi:hypothetical protein
LLGKHVWPPSIVKPDAAENMERLKPCLSTYINSIKDIVKPEKRGTDI